jgi:rRNA maturation protein Nop10
MVRCEKCQTDLPQTAKYCLNCGARVGKSTPAKFSINADDLVKRVRGLLHEGNVTKIIVRNEKGKLLLELPVTAGLIGAVIAPWLAVLGATAALVTKCTVTVERRE